jgi:3-hydroxyacyl-CoA dehydrogenase
LQGYLPAGSALAALAAAGWGIFVYLRDQRRNLQLRTQVEIASNLSRRIDRDQGEAVKSAQVVSALAALTALADQSADKDKLLNDVTNVLSLWQ